HLRSSAWSGRCQGRFQPGRGRKIFGEISGARRKIFVTVRATAEPAPAWTPAVERGDSEWQGKRAGHLVALRSGWFLRVVKGPGTTRQAHAGVVLCGRPGA